MTDTKGMEIPEEIYHRLREFPEFSEEAVEMLETSLKDSVRSIQQMYVNGDTNLLWDTMDKFALHVISINGLLKESPFKKAVSDLTRSEKEFDVLSDEQQNALFAISGHLYLILTFTKRSDYHKELELITDPSNDVEYMKLCFARFRKPSTFQEDNLVDIILKNIWDKLTKLYNSDFIGKRMRRIEHIESVLTNIKS